MNQDAPGRLAALLRERSENARPRSDCPAPERLWSAVRLELPVEERVAIVDHTIECAACAEAWRIAMTVREPEDFARRAAPASTRARVGAKHLAMGLAAAAALYLLVRVSLPRVDPVLEQPDVARVATNTPTSSPIVASLDDGGGRITLAQDGTVATTTPLSAADEARIRAALLMRRIEGSQQLAALRANAGTLMGSTAGTGFTLLAPVATFVAADRPTLTWSAMPGAHGYAVTVSDVAANYREVAATAALRVTSWTVPEPLARGRIYSWQVVAHTPEGDVKAPTPRDGEAKFQVLPRAVADELAARAAGLKDSHLALGLLYAEAGLLDQAEAELRELARVNQKSDVANDVLQALLQLRAERERRTRQR